MIWCVEDDAGIREIELYALSSTGLEARGFEDGASFWAALQSDRPELVLLDVMLPGTDGVSLLKRMNILCYIASALQLSFEKNMRLRMPQQRHR